MTTFTANDYFSPATIARIKEFQDRILHARNKRLDVNIHFENVGRNGRIYHGFSRHENDDFRSLYTCFRNIIQRCENPNHPRYKDYGMRGIQNHFTSFVEFARYVGIRPGPDYSIDRIDVNGHYEPGNVKWSDRFEQARNKRVPPKKPTIH